MLALVTPVAWGFSIEGPIGNGSDSWQEPAIGYGDNGVATGELGAPKRIGEGYRRNTPVIYYSYDGPFMTFFGPNRGDLAVDGAFAIINSTMTNNPAGITRGLDGYSVGLTEFPLNTLQYNYLAQSLSLTDLKSSMLWMMMEQLGLRGAEKYTWTLRDRVVGPAGCQNLDVTYTVTQRNIESRSNATTYVYSPYVNGTLYSYVIDEFCGGTPTAFTVTFSPDPYAETFTSVAGFGIYQNSVVGGGGFYTGLTRDDAMGLRYLLSSNNIAYENPAPRALLIQTNLGGTIPLTTLDLGQLLLAAQTNSPALLAALFPNVTVVSSSNYWTVLCTPNVTSYLTNFYGEPVGTPPHFVIVTNGFTCLPLENFVDTFGNVITNGNLTNTANVVVGSGIRLNFSTNTSGKLITISIGTQAGAPVGSPPVTNTTTKNITITNQIAGEYFVVPAGQCGWQFLNPQPHGFPIANVVATTNVITSATNANGFIDSQSIVTYFTNHTYIVQPIACSNVTDIPRLRQGVEQVQFVRVNFDSTLGQFFQPFTNFYTMTMVTNGQRQVQRFMRVITQPDLTVSVDGLLGNTVYDRTLDFDTSTVSNNAAGPGTILQTPGFIHLPEVMPVYVNSFFLAGFNIPSEFSQVPGFFNWASFDGTTNLPVLYPGGDIQNLINQIVITVSPAPPDLPSGDTDSAYGPVTFTATGGPFTPPYSWSATGLPDGLTMSTDGVLSGTPNQFGTFDVTVTLTDLVGRTVHWDYTLLIF